MPKKVISPALEREIKELYDDSIAKGTLPRAILPKINNMLKASGHGGYTSEKSLYNLINSFGVEDAKILDVSKSTAMHLEKQVDKKLKNIINFDMDLAWQNEFTKEIATRLFNRFIVLDQKGDKVSQRDLIEMAKVALDAIDQGVKIDALNAKKIDINNPSGNTTVGIVLHMDGAKSKRLEEVTANIVSEGPNNNLILEEASYG